MPKRKTHKGARKRFKVSRKGKVLHAKMNRRHLMVSKDSKRRRGLRKPGKLSDTQAAHIRSLLPYDN